MRVVLILGCVAALALLVASKPLKQDQASKGVQKQINQLKKLKCRPTKQKLNIRGLLPSHSELLDLNFFPKVVMLKRCDESCSYCGSNLGVETKTCQPAKTKKKKYYVYHYNTTGDKVYDFFKAEEHVRCGCQVPVNTTNNNSIFDEHEVTH